MIVSFLLAASLSTACGSGQTLPATGHPVSIPVDDRNGNFFVNVTTTSGATLVLYSDSGGGGPFLFSDTAERAGLAGPDARPEFSCKAWIPLQSIKIAPVEMRKHIPIDLGDGLLGGRWFDGNTWTWDYPSRALYWRAQHDVPNVASDHVVVLHFQRSAGSHSSGFPRIEASIAGKTMSFLMDTGARTQANAAAQQLGHFPGEPFATSFVEESIARTWHSEHPDWMYLTSAERFSNAAMIRVPQVAIGGFIVGPVWFVERPDTNFSGMMSQYMDAPVVGAIGGSALQHFRLTVDYAAERAYFEQP